VERARQTRKALTASGGSVVKVMDWTGCFWCVGGVLWVSVNGSESNDEPNIACWRVGFKKKKATQRKQEQAFGDTRRLFVCVVICNYVCESWKLWKIFKTKEKKK